MIRLIHFCVVTKDGEKFRRTVRADNRGYIPEALLKGVLDDERKRIEHYFPSRAFRLVELRATASTRTFNFIEIPKDVCRKEQGFAEDGNSCLQTPGTCESCPNWSHGSASA